MIARKSIIKNYENFSKTLLLTLKAPTSQNGQTHSKNLSAALWD